MAGYGSAREFAKRLGQSEMVTLLDETLAEEKNGSQNTQCDLQTGKCRG
jgi:ferritin-like metal-binding protein YciE